MGAGTTTTTAAAAAAAGGSPLKKPRPSPTTAAPLRPGLVSALAAAAGPQKEAKKDVPKEKEEASLPAARSPEGAKGGAKGGKGAKGKGKGKGNAAGGKGGPKGGRGTTPRERKHDASLKPLFWNKLTEGQCTPGKSLWSATAEEEVEKQVVDVEELKEMFGKKAAAPKQEEPGPNKSLLEGDTRPKTNVILLGHQRSQNIQILLSRFKLKDQYEKVRGTPAHRTAPSLLLSPPAGLCLPGETRDCERRHDLPHPGERRSLAQVLPYPR